MTQHLVSIGMTSDTPSMPSTELRPPRSTARSTVRGGSALDLKVVSALLAAQEDGPLARLLARELDVLRLMAEELTNSGITSRLFLSPHHRGTRREPDDQAGHHRI